MPPAAIKSKLASFSIKGQGHKFIDPGVIWKGWVSMPNKDSVSYGFKSYGKYYYLLPQTDTQTEQKLDAPEFHTGSMKKNIYETICIHFDCITFLNKYNKETSQPPILLHVDCCTKFEKSSQSC